MIPPVIVRAFSEDTTSPRIEARHGCGEHHAALGLQQLRQRRFRAQEAAFHIHPELLIEGVPQLLLRETDEGHVAVEDAGVAHEDVELTEGPDGLLDRAFVVL